MIEQVKYILFLDNVLQIQEECNQEVVKKNLINIMHKIYQEIKPYREPFEGGKGYLINTADYSGAELIVMASHAQDHRLLELSKGDMHSHFATKSWRSIYKNRANKHKRNSFKYYFISIRKEIYEEEYEYYFDLSNNFTVTKDNPKGFRQHLNLWLLV